MMDKIFKLAGVKNEQEFYNKYSSPEAFLNEFGQKGHDLLNEMKQGGIHINPAKKGTFKAQATRMGMGVQEAASHILAHKENYSPAMVKKAVFAHNFAKQMGGSLQQYGFAGEVSPNAPIDFSNYVPASNNTYVDRSGAGQPMQVVNGAFQYVPQPQIKPAATPTVNGRQITGYTYDGTPLYKHETGGLAKFVGMYPLEKFEFAGDVNSPVDFSRYASNSEGVYVDRTGQNPNLKLVNGAFQSVPQQPTYTQPVPQTPVAPAKPISQYEFRNGMAYLKKQEMGGNLPMALNGLTVQGRKFEGVPQNAFRNANGYDPNFTLGTEQQTEDNPIYNPAFGTKGNSSTIYNPGFGNPTTIPPIYNPNFRTPGTYDPNFTQPEVNGVMSTVAPRDPASFSKAAQMAAQIPAGSAKSITSTEVPASANQGTGYDPNFTLSGQRPLNGKYNPGFKLPTIQRTDLFGNKVASPASAATPGTGSQGTNTEPHTGEGFIKDDYVFNTNYDKTVNSLKDSKWNQGLAGTNIMFDPQTGLAMLPNKGLIGKMKGFAGLASGLSGSVLGYEKLFKGNESNLANERTNEAGKTADVLAARRGTPQNYVVNSTYAGPPLPPSIPADSKSVYKFNPKDHPEEYNAQNPLPADTMVDPGNVAFNMTKTPVPKVANNNYLQPPVQPTQPTGLPPVDWRNATNADPRYKFKASDYPIANEDTTLGDIDPGKNLPEPEQMSPVQMPGLSKFLPGYTPSSAQGMINGALPEGAAFTYNTPTPVGNMVKTTPQPWMQNSPFIQQGAQQSAPTGLPSINYPQKTSVPQVAPVPVTTNFTNGYTPVANTVTPLQSAPVQVKSNPTPTNQIPASQQPVSTPNTTAPVIQSSTTDDYNYDSQGDLVMPNGNTFYSDIAGSFKNNYGQPGTPSYETYKQVEPFLPRTPRDLTNDYHEYATSNKSWQQRHTPGPVKPLKFADPNGPNTTIGNYAEPVTIEPQQLPGSIRLQLLSASRNPKNNSGTSDNEKYVAYDSSTGNAYTMTWDQNGKPLYQRIENPNPSDFYEYNDDSSELTPIGQFPRNGISLIYNFKPNTQQAPQTETQNGMKFGGLSKYVDAGTIRHTDNPELDYQELYRTTTKGDPLGQQMANNAITGLGAAAQSFSEADQQRQYKKMLRNIDTTDFKYQTIDPENPFGNYTPNAGPASNFSLVTNTPVQDFGTHTVAAKYGGSMKKPSKSYREGGTYVLTPQEVREILRNGGEIEYLD